MAWTEFWYPVLDFQTCLTISYLFLTDVEGNVGPVDNSETLASKRDSGLERCKHQTLLETKIIDNLFLTKATNQPYPLGPHIAIQLLIFEIHWLSCVRWQESTGNFLEILVTILASFSPFCSHGAGRYSVPWGPFIQYLPRLCPLMKHTPLVQFSMFRNVSRGSSLTWKVPLYKCGPCRFLLPADMSDHVPSSLILQSSHQILSISNMW